MTLIDYVPVDMSEVCYVSVPLNRCNLHEFEILNSPTWRVNIIRPASPKGASPSFLSPSLPLALARVILLSAPPNHKSTSRGYETDEPASLREGRHTASRPRVAASSVGVPSTAV